MRRRLLQLERHVLLWQFLRLLGHVWIYRWYMRLPGLHDGGLLRLRLHWLRVRFWPDPNPSTDPSTEPASDPPPDPAPDPAPDPLSDTRANPRTNDFVATNTITDTSPIGASNSLAECPPNGITNPASYFDANLATHTGPLRQL